MPSLVLYENPNDPAVPMVMVLNDMVLSDNSDFSPPPTGFSYEYIPAYKLSARDPDMFFVLETGPGPYFEQRVLRTKNPYGFDAVVKNSQVEQANRLTKKNNEVISIDNVDAPFVTQLELVFDFYPAHSAFKVTVLYITDQDQLQLANDTWNKVAVMKTNIAMLHEHMLQQRIYAEATLIANQIVSINMANFYAFLEQQQAATNKQPKNTTLHARQAPSKHLKSKTVTQPPPSWNNPPKRRSSYKVTGSTPIETANLVVKQILKRGNLPTPTVAPAAPIMLSSNAIQIQNSASSAQLDAANLEKAFTINLINALLASLEPTAQDTPLNERALNALLENIIAIYNSNPSANKDKLALQNICRLLAMHVLPVDICLLGSKSLQELTKAGKIDQNISGMLLNALLAQVATQLDVLKESSNEDKAALLSILDVGGLGDYIFAECYDNYLPIVNELFATLLPKQQPEQTIMSTQDVEPPAALSTRPTPIRKKTHIVKKSKEIPLEQALRELGIKAKAATTAEIYQQAVQNIDSKNPDSALTKLQSIEKAITRDEALVLLQYVIEKALDVKDAKKLLQFLTEKAGNQLLTKDKHGDNIFDLCIKHYVKKSTANHENVAAILEILAPQVTQHISLRNEKNEVDLHAAIYFFKNATGSNFIIDLFEKFWDRPTFFNVRIAKLIEAQVKALIDTTCDEPILLVPFSALAIAKDSHGKNILCRMHEKLGSKAMHLREQFGLTIGLLHTLYSEVIRTLDRRQFKSETINLSAYSFDFANIYNVDLDHFTDTYSKHLQRLTIKLDLNIEAVKDFIFKFHILHDSRKTLSGGLDPYYPGLTQVVTPPSLIVSKYLLHLINTEPKGIDKPAVNTFIRNWLLIEAGYKEITPLYAMLGEFYRNPVYALTAADKADIIALMQSVKRQMQGEIIMAAGQQTPIPPKRWSSPGYWDSIAVACVPIMFDMLAANPKGREYLEFLQFAVFALQESAGNGINMLHHVCFRLNDINLDKDDEHTAAIKSFLKELGVMLRCDNMFRSRDTLLLDALCRQKSCSLPTGTGKAPLEMIIDTSANKDKRKLVFNLLRGTGKKATYNVNVHVQSTAQLKAL